MLLKLTLLFIIISGLFATPAMATRKPPFWHPAKHANTIKPSDRITLFNQPAAISLLLKAAQR